MKIVLSLFILCSAYSCYNNSNSMEASEGDNIDNFFQIKYKSLLKNKKEICLSEIATEVEYILLETNDECVIGNNPQYFFTDSLIFVNNNYHILKFTRNGKFLTKIGSRGRGPQEIDFIRTMSVLPEKQLIAVQKNSEPKLLYFSFSGSFIKSTPVPHFYNLKVIADGNYLGYESDNLGSEKFNFILMTEKTDTLSVVYNTNTWINNSTRSLDIPHSFEPFYVINNQTHFKSLYNDTVYNISSNSIVSGYYVNLGKFTLPPKFRPPEKVLLDPSKMQMFYKEAIKYFYCNVFESAGNVFLKTANFKDRDIRYFVYDKNTQEGYMLVDEAKEPSGIINDWDGGIDFWPVGNFGNNKIYMPVSVVDIKYALSEGKSGLNFNEEKNTILRELLSDIDDAGNPIIMVVTL